jgi:hypothetical protein
MRYRYLLVPLIALIAGCASSDREYVHDYDNDDRYHDGRIAYDRDCDRYYDRRTGDYDRDCDWYYNRRIRGTTASPDAANAQAYRVQAQQFRQMAELRRAEADRLAIEFGPSNSSVIQKREEADALLARANAAEQKANELSPQGRDTVQY